MTAMGVTAITNIILAGEVLFFTGLLMGNPINTESAAFSWALAMFFLGLSALLGAIDHGFFEERGDTKIRIWLMHFTWYAIGMVTFFVVTTIAKQFLPQEYHNILYISALIQFIIFVIMVKRISKFLIVIVNYAPVMLAFLIFNFIGLNNGTGSWYMIIGLLLSFAAAILQVMKVQVSNLIDHNGLYHFVMMPAVFFLYLGGLAI